MKNKLVSKLGNVNKKARIGLGLLILFVVIIVLALVNFGEKDKKPLVTSKKNKDIACKTMTFDSARNLLGDTVQLDPAKSNTATEDMELSSCTYKQTGATAENGKLQAGLEVKTPTTDDGKASNKQAFKGKTLGGLKDSPYGDAAFYDEKGGKLNVLKKDTWYVITYGPLNPAARNLSQTEELADTIVSRFNN